VFDFDAADIAGKSLILMTAVAMAGGSMWAGGKLAPWFLREKVAAPSVRQLILSDDETEVSYRLRVTACGLSLAVMLATLLAVVLGARAIGWHPNA
jgi:hypothetical protein